MCLLIDLWGGYSQLIYPITPSFVGAGPPATRFHWGILGFTPIRLSAISFITVQRASPWGSRGIGIGSYQMQYITEYRGNK